MNVESFNNITADELAKFKDDFNKRDTFLHMERSDCKIRQNKTYDKPGGMQQGMFDSWWKRTGDKIREMEDHMKDMMEKVDEIMVAKAGKGNRFDT